MTEEQADQLINLMTDISTKLDALITFDHWILGAIMFIAGMFPFIAFLLGKGDK